MRPVKLKLLGMLVLVLSLWACNQQKQSVGVGAPQSGKNLANSENTSDGDIELSLTAVDLPSAENTTSTQTPIDLTSGNRDSEKLMGYHAVPDPNVLAEAKEMGVSPGYIDIDGAFYYLSAQAVKLDDGCYSFILEATGPVLILDTARKFGSSTDAMIAKFTNRLSLLSAGKMCFTQGILIGFNNDSSFAMQGFSSKNFISWLKQSLGLGEPPGFNLVFPFKKWEAPEGQERWGKNQRTQFLKSYKYNVKEHSFTKEIYPLQHEGLTAPVRDNVPIRAWDRNKYSSVRRGKRPYSTTEEVDWVSEFSPTLKRPWHDLTYNGPDAAAVNQWREAQEQGFYPTFDEWEKMYKKSKDYADVQTHQQGKSMLPPHLPLGINPSIVRAEVSKARLQGAELQKFENRQIWMLAEKMNFPTTNVKEYQRDWDTWFNGTDRDRYHFAALAKVKSGDLSDPLRRSIQAQFRDWDGADPLLHPVDPPQHSASFEPVSSNGNGPPMVSASSSADSYTQGAGPASALTPLLTRGQTVVRYSLADTSPLTATQIASIRAKAEDMVKSWQGGELGNMSGSEVTQLTLSVTELLTNRAKNGDTSTQPAVMKITGGSNDVPFVAVVVNTKK